MHSITATTRPLLLILFGPLLLISFGPLLLIPFGCPHYRSASSLNPIYPNILYPNSKRERRERREEPLNQRWNYKNKGKEVWKALWRRHGVVAVIIRLLTVDDNDRWTADMAASQQWLANYVRLMRLATADSHYKILLWYQLETEKNLRDWLSPIWSLLFIEENYIKNI